MFCEVRVEHTKDIIRIFRHLLGSSKYMNKGEPNNNEDSEVVSIVQNTHIGLNAYIQVYIVIKT